VIPCACRSRAKWRLRRGIRPRLRLKRDFVRGAQSADRGGFETETPSLRSSTCPSARHDLFVASADETALLTSYMPGDYD